MVDSIKRRGQKLIRKFSRTSIKVGLHGKAHIRANVIERVSHVKNIRLLILEWGILVFALFILSLAQAFWFRDSYAEEVFINGGGYIEATLGRVNSMNPLFAVTNSEKVLSRLMFATLTDIDFTGHVGNGLAEQVVAREGGKVWAIKLREGLKWSDGEPITVSDVIFTINLIKDPVVSSIYSTSLDSVEVSLGEGDEIVFTLAKPYADFSMALNFPVVPEHILAGVSPKTLIEHNFSNAPVTSGAFTFNAIQTIQSSDEEVIYLANNPYYYRGKPFLDNFAIHTFSDKNSLIRALNSGLISGTAELSGSETGAISSSVFLEKQANLNAGVFIFFNTTKGVLKDRSLRAAIRQGLDLAKIREAAPNHAALDYPILDSQIQLSSYPALPGYDFDAAKQKIDQILNGAPVDLNVVTVNSGYLPAVADSVKNQLATLGFGVNVMSYDETQDFIASVISRRNYDILIYEVELGVTPDQLPYYHSSQANATGLNLSNYHNEIADDLLAAARETLDIDLRKKKYETFLNYWVNDVPSIGLYQANLTYTYNRNTRVFGSDQRLVTALDRFYSVESWASVWGYKDKTP